MMNCPKCSVALVPGHVLQIDVDKCPNCSGVWLDYQDSTNWRTPPST